MTTPRAIRFPVYVRPGAAEFEEFARLSRILGTTNRAVASVAGSVASISAGTSAANPREFSLQFANELSGPVFRSRPDGVPLRLWLDDSDPANPLWPLELAATTQNGDLTFASVNDGLVLPGRYHGSWWRIYASQPEPDARFLRWEHAGAIRSADYQFGNPGAGIVLRGRTNKSRWQLFMDDSAGDDASTVLPMWEVAL